jgi:hypothetical protein
MIDKVPGSGTTPAILLWTHATHYIEHVTKLLVALLAAKKADNFTQFLSALVFILFFLDSIYK